MPLCTSKTPMPGNGCVPPRLRRERPRRRAAVRSKPGPYNRRWRTGVCMAYVIAQPCIGTKDTSCVVVCPVDCIHPTKDEAAFAEAEMLYIDPDTCIDCNL